MIIILRFLDVVLYRDWNTATLENLDSRWQFSFYLFQFKCVRCWNRKRNQMKSKTCSKIEDDYFNAMFNEEYILYCKKSLEIWQLINSFNSFKGKEIFKPLKIFKVCSISYYKHSNFELKCRSIFFTLEKRISLLKNKEENLLHFFYTFDLGYSVKKILSFKRKKRVPKILWPPLKTI